MTDWSKHLSTPDSLVPIESIESANPTYYCIFYVDDIEIYSRSYISGELGLGKIFPAKTDLLIPPKPKPREAVYYFWFPPLGYERKPLIYEHEENAKSQAKEYGGHYEKHTITEREDE